MLRIVRLAETTVEPGPVSLDTGHALDGCLRRDGWIAFWPNLDVWGLPVPFDAPPFSVAKDTRLVAAGRDSRTIWLQQRDGSVISEYDGLAREIRREVELPAELVVEEFHVAGETSSGFILGREYGGGLFAWEPPGRPQLLLGEVTTSGVDPTGTTVLAWRPESDELVLFDLRQKTDVAVPKPDRGRWPLHGPLFVSGASFSPNGAWLAVDLDYSAEHTEEEDLVSLRELVEGRGESYEPQPHRLGIIRCSDGEMTVAEGEYDNLANVVWDLDGEWIISSTPFAPRGLWLTRWSDATLERVTFKQNTPSLLCDVSDLVR